MPTDSRPILIVGAGLGNLRWLFVTARLRHCSAVITSSANQSRAVFSISPIASRAWPQRETRSCKRARNILLPIISGIDFFEERIADRLAELTVNYRHSPIVENHGTGAPRAGERAPDAELRDGNGKARRLFELFREPRHTLLLFLGALAEERDRSISLDSLGNLIQVYRIVRGHGTAASGDLLDISGTVHSLYQLMGGGIVLVRPDGYIAFRCNDLNIESLRRYLLRIFSLGGVAGRPATLQAPS
jgi:hypothetical protein